MTDAPVPTGDILFEELVARQWDLATLAERADLPLALVAGIIDGDEAITARIAVGLSRALGTSAMIWIRLDRAYRDSCHPPT